MSLLWPLLIGTPSATNTPGQWQALARHQETLTVVWANQLKPGASSSIPRQVATSYSEQFCADMIAGGPI